jgi:hypothetical protein
MGFPDLLHAAEVAAGGGSRVLGGHPGSHVRVRQQIQMHLDLFGEFGVLATAENECAQARKHDAKRAHTRKQCPE